MGDFLNQIDEWDLNLNPTSIENWQHQSIFGVTNSLSKLHDLSNEQKKNPMSMSSQVFNEAFDLFGAVFTTASVPVLRMIEPSRRTHLIKFVRLMNEAIQAMKYETEPIIGIVYPLVVTGKDFEMSSEDSSSSSMLPAEFNEQQEKERRLNAFLNQQVQNDQFPSFEEMVVMKENFENGI